MTWSFYGSYKPMNSRYYRVCWDSGAGIGWLVETCDKDENVFLRIDDQGEYASAK